MKKHYQWGVVAIVVISIVVICSVFWRHQENVALRDALAKAFNRSSDFIEINLPPADGRYPGTVMLSPQNGQIIPMRRVYRPTQVPNISTSLQIKITDKSDAALVSKLIGNAASTGGVVVDVTMNQLRLYEADMNKSFKDNLLSDESVYLAEKRGSKPRVIVRSYEAILSFKINKDNSLSVEAWQKKQKELLNAGGHLAEEGSVVFTHDEPSVIAYESVMVNYVATSLSEGKPNDIKFVDALPINTSSATLNLSDYRLIPASKNVKYVLAGNSQYESKSFANLRIVEPSIGLVKSVFETVGAKSLLHESAPNNLSQATLDAYLQKIVEESKLAKPSLLVFYYTGHAVAGRGGQLYLVMSDYKGNPSQDLGDDLMLGLSRAKIEEPSSPLGGTNISDIMDAVVAIQSLAPIEVKGLVPVSKISQILDEANIPFAILIDACYEHNQMEKLRDALTLTKSGDFYGPTIGESDSTIRYAHAIQQFGVSPYLHSKNIIIFSATPGTVALEVADPRPHLGEQAFVAPLARRVSRNFESVLVQSEPISWGDYLNSMVEVKPLGERKLFGTVSWSDFDWINTIPMLQTKEN